VLLVFVVGWVVKMVDFGGRCNVSRETFQAEDAAPQQPAGPGTFLAAFGSPKVQQSNLLAVVTTAIDGCLC
jgi:hypothetical protein